MHSRIFIIGFMGSGKTTNGKKIARMMGYKFMDMDAWITEKEGLSIPELFDKYGEDYFRKLETDAIQQLSEKEKFVISAGGGAPCFGNNMELMNESGLTVYLKLSPGALFSRLKDSHAERPLIAGKSDEEIRETIEELFKKREPFYEKASMIIDGLDIVNERMVNAIQRR